MVIYLKKVMNLNGFLSAKNSPLLKTFHPLNRNLLFFLLLLLFSCSSETKNQEGSSSQISDSHSVIAKKHPSWFEQSTSILYFHLSEEQNFNTLANQLNQVQDINFNIIALHNLLARSLENQTEDGSPLVADYTKINSNLGTFEDLQSAISKMHELSLRVILDWDLLYTGKDHSWRTSHPEWFGKDLDRQSVLNYESTQMMSTMIESMRFWMNTLQVDGFHLLNTDQIPSSFLIDMKRRLGPEQKYILIAEVNQIRDGQAEYFDLVRETTSNDISLRDQIINQFKSYNSTNQKILPVYRLSAQQLNQNIEQHLSLAILLPGLSMIDHQILQPGLYQYLKKLLNLKYYNHSLWNNNQQELLWLVENENLYAFVRKGNGNFAALIDNFSNTNQTFNCPIDVRQLSNLTSDRRIQFSKDQEISIAAQSTEILAHPSILLE